MILGLLFSRGIVLVANGRGGLRASEMELRFLGTLDRRWKLHGGKSRASASTRNGKDLYIRVQDRKTFARRHDVSS